MADITLRVHSKGNESHEITTPTDIISSEFIAELLKGLRLPEIDNNGRPIPWEVDDKDNGQTLIQDKTLQENGVLEGHNLYLRPAAPPPPSAPPPLPRVAIDPVTAQGSPRPKPAWPLWVALVLIPVAGIAGYFSAEGQSEKIRAELQAARVQINDANKKNAVADALAKQLEQDNEQLRHDADDKSAATTKLQTDLSSKDTLIATQNKHIAQLTAQASQQDADAARKAEQIKGLQASTQKLQDVQGQLTAAQQATVAERQRSQSSQQAIENLQQQLQGEKTRQRYGFLTWTGNAGKNPVDINGNRPNVGSLTGSALPGTECILAVVDPDRVSIITRPAASNKWSRVSFRVTGNGLSTVTLIWTLR